MFAYGRQVAAGYNPIVRGRMQSKLLTIRGRVQGVNYRFSMQRQAQNLGVCGWVRNRGDGSVEAQVAGEIDSLDRIICWAKSGPEAAQVESVEALDAGDYAGNGFVILPSE